MGYYDGRDLPFYWNVAEEYVLFDRFFAASPGGSVATTCSGYRHGRRSRGPIPAEGSAACRRSSTGSRRKGSRGSSTSRTTTRDVRSREGRRSAQAVRVPVRDFPRFVPTGSCQPCVDLDEFYDDLERGHAARRRLHRAGGRERAPAGRRRRRRDPDQVADDGPGAQQRVGRARRSCGPTTSGAAGSTTSGRRRGAASGCRRCWSARTRGAGYVDSTPLDTPRSRSSSATGGSRRGGADTQAGASAGVRLRGASARGAHRLRRAPGPASARSRASG